MEDRQIIIIGTGRSGTAYTAKLLRGFGLDIGHETMGSDGISSWYLTDDTPNDHSPSWEDFSELDPIIGHQLRDPLKAIPSLMTINNASWKFIRESSITSFWDKKILLRSMRHWLEWNQAAFEKAEFHWTLKGLRTEIKPFLMEAIPNLTHDKFVSGLDLVEKPVNSSKTRVLNFRIAMQTSPVVFARRLRQAYFPLKLTREKMRGVDHVLADEIHQFFMDCKASIRFQSRTGEL